MNGPRYRAFRYYLPDLEATDEFAGFRYSATGGVQMIQEDESVRQAILLLISTIPGERVMRPDYGCLLHRLLFSPNDDTTAGLAIHYVRRALDRWEPRIEVVDLDAGRSEEVPERLDIVLEYRVRATQRVARMVFPVNLQGEGSI